MPDQSQVTGAIAQGVQNNDTASNSSNTAPQGDSMAQFDPTPSLLGRIIMGTRAHDQYLSQRLVGKQQEELMAKEQQFKLSTAKKQAEFATWDQLVSQGGSKVFNSPEAQKYFHKDPELYDAYKQKAQLADTQSALSGVMNQYIAQQLGMNLPPQVAAQMTPDQQKMLGTAAKAKFEQTKEGVELAKEGISLQKAQVELTKAGVELNKARMDKTDKQGEKLEAAWKKTLNSLGEHRNTFIKEYSRTKSDGTPVYSEDQAIKSVSARNEETRRLAKQAEKDGQPFDPDDFLLQVRPGAVIPGWISKDSGKRGMYTIEPVPSTNVPTSPTEQAAPQQGTPTGPGAANKALAQRPAGVPPNAVPKMYQGKLGWWDDKGKNFYPNA